MELPASSLDAGFRRRLLAWFQSHRRDLPWRKTRDPYRIWVSEIMLQQTQVATVIPYFLRFMKTFPTVQALAEADEQSVLRLWEGLGYYRRARHLLQAARQLVAEHGGMLHDDPEVWRELPGIGRYTLGAILSQAFDRRMPILEANSVRVLCRLLAIRGSPKTTAVQKRLWESAESMLPRKRTGDFNQALMELGALVCTPTTPQCGKCPVRVACRASQLGIQEKLPARVAAPKTVTVTEVAVVVRRGLKVLIVQRPEAGRWANLWEFPHCELERHENPVKAAERMLPKLTGITADVGLQLTKLTHTVTRYSITLFCWEAVYRGGKFQSSDYQQGRWIDPAQLAQLPLSAPQRRLAQLLQSTTQFRSR